jgi:P-type E1-E2 ATPase
MIVRAGEAVPTDGVITEGRATIDESIVTGESVPVTKNIGDDVIGGTICADSTLKVEVTSNWSETFLARFIGIAKPRPAPGPLLTRVLIPIT